MEESSNFLQPSVPKFDGYFEHWSMLMENLIRSKELWPLIETGVMVAPPNAMAEQLRIANESKLQDLKLQALRREFELLVMKEGESVNDFFSRTLTIANCMTAQGERMEQNTIVEKILRSMAPKFNYVVYLIEQSNDVTTLSIEELQKDLVMEEVEEEIPVEEGGGEGRILKQLNATSATNLDLIKVLAHIGVLVSIILNLMRKNFF
ncbi:hypothetical protein L195_g051210 [Trifolium pratense]|uniref:Retrovirus-related Pol polyprotein from transposon TNT 1-94 n=1 Tax=Trifolium pratense TaxID=57577 RepID=A0A2K3JYF0_TRIPR|nr:hypothetical protein L195_g051210 [Trifolium pratense]